MTKKLIDRKRKQNRQRKRYQKCLRKRFYNTEDEAIEAVEATKIHNFSTDKHKKNRTLHHYLCPYCDRWHIGTKRNYNPARDVTQP